MDTNANIYLSTNDYGEVTNSVVILFPSYILTWCYITDDMMLLLSMNTNMMGKRVG